MAKRKFDDDCFVASEVLASPSEGLALGCCNPLDVSAEGETGDGEGWLRIFEGGVSPDAGLVRRLAGVPSDASREGEADIAGSGRWVRGVPG